MNEGVKAFVVFIAVIALFTLAMCGFTLWMMWADMIREWSGRALWGYPIAIAPLIAPAAAFIAVAYYKGKFS